MGEGVEADVKVGVGMTVEGGVRVGVGIFSVLDVGTVVITGDGDIAGVDVEIRVGLMEGVLARVGVGVDPER